MQNLAACQRPGGAFLREGQAKVVSCVPTPAPAADAKPAAKSAKKGAAAADGSSSSSAPAPTFDLVLDDTVLFPEGGGQPTDTGVLACEDGTTARVLQVLRTPNGILHRVDKSIAPTTPVKVSIDWDRRFDHMVCHSSQHLISAVARADHNLKTMSWWLSAYPQPCHIEFDASDIAPETIVAIESAANEWIRRAAPFKLHAYESLAAAKADELFATKVQKAIPDTHEGAIRVIELEGLECNPCCGTHLESTAQMQLIKLTRVEKSKTSVKVFFLTGSRTLHALTASLDVNRGLTALLSCAPEHFVEKVRGLQTDARASAKTLANVLKALAEADAAKLVAKVTAGEKAIQLHRDEVGLTYLSDVALLLADALKAAAFAGDYVLFASSSDAPGGAVGAFILTGTEAIVTNSSAELATKLGGKGGGRKDKYQGKAQAMDEKARADAFAYLQAQVQ